MLGISNWHMNTQKDGGAEDVVERTWERDNKRGSTSRIIRIIYDPRVANKRVTDSWTARS